MTSKAIYGHKLYWYHISTTLTTRTAMLRPLSDGFNRPDTEPCTKRICVAPTIEQCITAVPYVLGDSFNIYRTKSMIIANPPVNVFDSDVTHEGWLYTPTRFIKVGQLNFTDIEIGLDVGSVIEEAATSGDASSSGKVLKWWQRAKIKRFVVNT